MIWFVIIVVCCLWCFGSGYLCGVAREEPEPERLPPLPHPPDRRKALAVSAASLAKRLEAAKSRTDPQPLALLLGHAPADLAALLDVARSAQSLWESPPTADTWDGAFRRIRQALDAFEALP